jgi:hypothetical protein
MKSQQLMVLGVKNVTIIRWRRVMEPVSLVLTMRGEKREREKKLVTLRNVQLMRYLKLMVLGVRNVV